MAARAAVGREVQGHISNRGGRTRLLAIARALCGLLPVPCASGGGALLAANREFSCGRGLGWALIGSGQAWARARPLGRLGPGQSLTEPRYGAVAATLPSGQVLIAGGQNNGAFLSSAELFDPATDTFTKLTGAGQSLTEPRAARSRRRSRTGRS